MSISEKIETTKETDVRLPWDEYFLNIAKAVSLRSTCYSSKYGCVIVKDKTIISTGYNGSPRGAKNCTDMGYCSRDHTGLSRYSECRAVHSEANALLHGTYADMVGSDMYIARGVSSGSSHKVVIPCKNCQRLILNACISRVICLQEDNQVSIFFPKDWIFEI